MKPRRILFWIHLSAGVLAGIVILIMSATGVTLAYEKQILRWANRGFHVESVGQARLPVSELIARLKISQGAAPSAVTLRAESGAPAESSFGRDRVLFVNPYSGDVLGESHKLPAFFAQMEDIHRWLGVSVEKRASGRAITGAANFVFFILVISGPFIWWPREWNWSNLKKIILFRGGLGGRALYWNWHNVFGIWCFAPLLIIVATGVVMSYPWANNLLYRMTGNEPPPPQTAGPSAAGRNRPAGENGRKHDHKEGSANSAAGSMAPSASPSPAPSPISEFEPFDKLVARAQQQVPRWQSMTIRLQGGRGPMSLSVDEGNGGRPDQRSQFLFDSQTNGIRWETFSSYNSGRRLRTWARFSHTGEAAGVFGQTIAALAAAGATVLVFTGLTLSIKRFFAWRARA